MSIRSNVDARRMDQRIRLERITVAQDDTGDPVPTWMLLLDQVYAAVDAMPISVRATEPNNQSEIMSVSDVTFWVRADVKQRVQLSILDRIVWRGTPYDIRDIPDQQLRGRLVAIVARTGMNNG